MIKKLYRFLNPKFQTLFLEYKVKFEPRYGHGKPAHEGLLKVVEQNRPFYENLLDQALSFKENIWSIQDSANEKDVKSPGWNNEFLPGLDIIGIYTMLSHFKPKRYVEVGSGNSTKVAFKARKEQGLDMEIVSVDPFPRVEIDELADKVVRKPFEDVDWDWAEMLEEGDVLFIDNSHRMLPNSDAMVVFMEVLPRLKKGVIVHFHDIYIPYDYPQFMCDRFYSEQYGLALFVLLDPKKYETLLPNYFISEDQELAQRIAPIWNHKNLQSVERHGGSYWLRIAQ